MRRRIVSDHQCLASLIIVSYAKYLHQETLNSILAIEKAQSS